MEVILKFSIIYSVLFLLTYFYSHTKFTCILIFKKFTISPLDTEPKKKRDFGTGVFLWVCNIFKNIFFIEHMRADCFCIHYNSIIFKRIINWIWKVYFLQEIKLPKLLQHFSVFVIFLLLFFYSQQKRPDTDYAPLLIIFSN